jgi:hypothetical protein
MVRPGQSRKLLLAAFALAGAVGLALTTTGPSRSASGLFAQSRPGATGLMMAENPPTTSQATTTSDSTTTSTAPALVLRDSDDGLGLLPKGPSDASTMLWRALASLVVIGVLLWLGVTAFKKILPRISAVKGRDISVQETLFLGPGKSVHLLKVGSRSLLLSGSRDGLRLLADVTGAIEPVPDSPAGQGESA